jgi:hypothetical protein
VLDSPLFGNIDDVLGPAATRFLGGPYRAVRRHVRDVDIRADNSGVVRLRATADISNPAAGSARSPHVDVIDVVLLAAEVIECGLAHALGLDLDERGRSHIRRLRVHPGRAPSHALHDIPIDLTMAVGDQDDTTAPLTWASGRVGPIRVSIGLAHPTGAVHTTPAHLEESTDLLGNGDFRYYADRFKWFDRVITNVGIDTVEQSLEATVSVVDDASVLPLVGFGARPDGPLSPVDAPMVSAQLAKALVCRSDDIDPRTDDVLLLRRLVATGEPGDHIPGMPCAVRLDRTVHRPVEVDGVRTHLDEITVRSPGVTGAFSIVNRFAGVLLA